MPFQKEYAEQGTIIMEKKNNGNQKTDLIRRGILILAAAGCVICIFCAVMYLMKGRHAGRVYEKLRQECVASGMAEQLPKADPQEQTEEEMPHEYEEMPVVDFETLWETNTDICAWIYIPGTEVNYPVLQNAAATDPHDTYYLDHTVDRVSGLPGAIYIEPCNARDFSDRNTVLYGHHMKNGTMFASLDRYKDNVFMEEHPYAYLVTPEQNMVYEVCAAVLYDNRHIMGIYDFEQDSSYQAFLDSLTDNRNMEDVFREGVEMTTDDRLITLSTCVKDQDDRRLIVEAVLIDVYEREN